MDYSPSLSADGRFLSFVSLRSGNREIWLKDLAPGSDGIPLQLTNHPTTDDAPALSRDGSQLLYVAYETDPRGDIHLLDLISGEKKRLSNLDNGETTPVWSRNKNEIFYTRLASAVNRQSVMTYNLSENREEILLEGASSCSQGDEGHIVCALAGKLYLLPGGDGSKKTEITFGSGLDSTPRFDKGKNLFFTRYELDSSGDGVVDLDDNSSIWMAQLHSSPPYLREPYRLTPGGGFHQHPAPAQGALYYSNLQSGDIIKLDTGPFLASYLDPIQAHAQAGAHFSRGESEKGLQILGNLVANPEHIAPKTQLLLELEYIEKLRDAGLFTQAEAVIIKLASQDDSTRAMAQVHSISLDIHKKRQRTSQAELRQLVKKGVRSILAVEKRHKKQFGKNSQLFGMAHMEASYLYLLADNSIAALAQLAKVDRLDDRQIQAQALFSRGKVYRHLKNDQGLKKLFMDVIRRFGEQSSWGIKAIAEAIAVSEKGSNYKHKIAALRELTRENPQFKQLGAATLLRIAEIYKENGEDRKTVTVLDEIGEKYPEASAPLIRTLWWKG